MIYFVNIAVNELSMKYQYRKWAKCTWDCWHLYWEIQTNLCRNERNGEWDGLRSWRWRWRNWLWRVCQHDSEILNVSIWRKKQMNQLSTNVENLVPILSRWKRSKKSFHKRPKINSRPCQTSKRVVWDCFSMNQNYQGAFQRRLSANQKKAQIWPIFNEQVDFSKLRE